MVKNEQKTNSRQKEILRETMYLIRQGGLQAVTMRKVADRVGIKEPSAYRYFPDKSKLLIGIINSMKNVLLAPIRKIESSEADPALRLKKIVTHHLNTVIKLDGLPMVFMAEIAATKKLDLTKHIRLLFEEYQGMLEDTIKELNPNIPSATVGEYSTLLIGMSASLAIQLRLGIKTNARKDIFEQLLPTIIQNIAKHEKSKSK
ncbi:TetR/AcrR family transcriptional regulator [bacterium AH-315-J21]|nr:TetR/AcrR family transcriptional regulator [bacterium AH-315-J21]